VQPIVSGSRAVCLAALLAGSASVLRAAPVVTGYIFPQDTLLEEQPIDLNGMTRVNFAFALIRDGRMVEGSANDGSNLAWLVAQKRAHPSLQVLISVGGWQGSGGFSDAARTPKSRSIFIDSVMAFLHTYDLDGLDLDWEYPGLRGAGNKSRKQDKHNFTLLLQELRAQFQKELQTTHKRYYLTIAAGASEEYLEHTEMAKVQRYVDAVNLMTYDYYQAGTDPTTGPNAPLFTDPADPKGESADVSVRAFEAAGVPAEKIVLGIPFYGRMWGDVSGQNHGLFQRGRATSTSYLPYSRIASSMLNHGFIRYWDADGAVPYLYDEQDHLFVSYDDPESVRKKCAYVVAHHLGGVMFWSYSDDTSGVLLETIDRALK